MNSWCLSFAIKLSSLRNVSKMWEIINQNLMNWIQSLKHPCCHVGPHVHHVQLTSLVTAWSSLSVLWDIELITFPRKWYSTNENTNLNWSSLRQWHCVTLYCVAVLASVLLRQVFKSLGKKIDVETWTQEFVGRLCSVIKPRIRLCSLISFPAWEQISASVLLWPFCLKRNNFLLFFPLFLCGVSGLFGCRLRWCRMAWANPN